MIPVSIQASEWNLNQHSMTLSKGSWFSQCRLFNQDSAKPLTASCVMHCKTIINSRDCLLKLWGQAASNGIQHAKENHAIARSTPTPPLISNYQKVHQSLHTRRALVSKKNSELEGIVEDPPLLVTLFSSSGKSWAATLGLHCWLMGLTNASINSWHVRIRDMKN